MFLFCVRASLKLSLLHWMPLDKYWLMKTKIGDYTFKFSNQFCWRQTLFFVEVQTGQKSLYYEPFVTWEVQHLVGNGKQTWFCKLLACASPVFMCRGKITDNGILNKKVIYYSCVWDVSWSSQQSRSGPRRKNKNHFSAYLFQYLFYFICHTIITKNKGKERKKEVVRRPNRNYRSLWEVRPPRTTG